MGKTGRHGAAGMDRQIHQWRLAAQLASPAATTTPGTVSLGSPGGDRGTFDHDHFVVIIVVVQKHLLFDGSTAKVHRGQLFDIYGCLL